MKLSTREAVAFFLIWMAYALGPAINVGDSRLSLPTAISIVRSGNFGLDEFPEVVALGDAYDVEPVGGHPVMAYPYAPTLFLVPVVAAADLVGIDLSQISIGSPNRTGVIEMPVGSILVVFAVFLFWRILKQTAGFRQSPSSQADWIAVIVLAFATSYWSAASRALSQHAAAAPFVVGSMMLAVRAQQRDRGYALVGATAMAAYVMRPTNAVMVAVLLLWVAKIAPKRLWQFVVGVGCIGLPFIIINHAVYGQWLAPYYTASKVHAPHSLDPFLGVALSPSRGLLIFSPVVVFSFLGAMLRIRQGRWCSLDTACAAILFTTYALVASWPNWWGGSTYGPRLLADLAPLWCWFLVPVIDAATAGAGRLSSRPFRFALAATIAVSVLIHFNGAFIRSTLCWNAHPGFVDDVPQRVWDWSDPQALRGVNDLFAGKTPAQVVYGSCGFAPNTPAGS